MNYEQMQSQPIQLEAEEQEAPPVPQSGDSGKEGNSLAKVLRVIGSFLLLGSAVAFMIQTWTLMSFTSRYLTFLGFTSILAIVGVYCGVRLKEAKGARSFLGIAAAFLPAHFVQLSAMLYHSFYGTPKGLNQYFIVTSDNLLEPLTLLALAIPVLSGVSYFAFSALMRAEAKLATLVYVIANIVLLVPTRNPDHIALLSMGVFAMLALYQDRRLKGKALTSSKEGMFSQMILAAPYAALLGRTMFLYNPTAFFQLAEVLTMTIISGYSAHALKNKQGNGEQQIQWLAERATFVGAAASWYLFCSAVFVSLPREISIPVLALPISAIYFALSFFVQDHGRGYRRLASWIAICAVMTQLVTEEGILSSAICLATSVLITAAAHEMKERGMFVAGVCGLLYGILYHLKYAAQFYAFSPWISLAVLGTIVLLSSSYLERYFPTVLERVREMRSDASGWK